GRGPVPVRGADRREGLGGRHRSVRPLVQRPQTGGPTGGPPGRRLPDPAAGRGHAVRSAPTGRALPGSAPTTLAAGGRPVVNPCPDLRLGARVDPAAAASTPGWSRSLQRDQPVPVGVGDRLPTVADAGLGED